MKSPILRRTSLGILLVMLVFFATSLRSYAAPPQLSVEDAFARSKSGEIVLVDIRTRSEWKETGVASTALTISMHERGFLQRLSEAVGADHDRPIALICATGGRSAFLQSQLGSLGFKMVYDVPAGMMGQKGKPGWIASGLPIKSPKE